MLLNQYCILFSREIVCIYRKNFFENAINNQNTKYKEKKLSTIFFICCSVEFILHQDLNLNISTHSFTLE